MAQDKRDDANFLMDNFDIPAREAAELVVEDDAEAQRLATELMRAERAKDPLEGVPVPGPEKDPEHLEKDVGDLEKPVVHRDSAPT